MRSGILTTVLAITAVAAVGCSHTTTTTPTSPSATPTATSSAVAMAPASAGPVLDVTIAGGKVTPADAQVQARVGQPITVHVTSDVADELHVHSTPDHEFAIGAAPNQTFTFTINSPGKVEVELHHLDKTIATVDVTP